MVGQQLCRCALLFRTTFWSVSRGDLLKRHVADEQHWCALFGAHFDQFLGVIYEARERGQAAGKQRASSGQAAVSDPKFPTHASP